LNSATNSDFYSLIAYAYAFSEVTSELAWKFCLT
jgi:hypothetical protein